MKNEKIKIKLNECETIKDLFDLFSNMSYQEKKELLDAIENFGKYFELNMRQQFIRNVLKEVDKNEHKQ